MFKKHKTLLSLAKSFSRQVDSIILKKSRVDLYFTGGDLSIHKDHTSVFCKISMFFIDSNKKYSKISQVKVISNKRVKNSILLELNSVPIKYQILHPENTGE